VGLPEYSLRDEDSVLMADDLTEEAFAEFDKYCRRTELLMLDHIMRGPAETPRRDSYLRPSVVDYGDPEDDAALLRDIFR
jgi:hypothetical protein